ncbi:MAG: nucleotidyltransferase family protein [Ruminococcus sp.]|jgi:predicted nucleotidyltransferase|nr:nucleotidyltransferase family protein [Ruminococcus sp.]
MKTFGIIAEYNPFHNGHKYHIDQVRAAGATHIVAIMSGNYVQRGDVALIDKFRRAEIAVQNGVDLVIELPVTYSLASAELFARSGMMMLGALGCVDGISFGAENPSLAMLQNAAEASSKASTPDKIRPLLEQGMSYPQAVQQIIGLEAGPLVAEVFDDPNNTLAVEYIKSLSYLNLDFEVLPIKRAGVPHNSEETSENYASASKIRQMIEDDEDISAFVPAETLETVKEYEENENLCYFDNLERELLCLLRKAVPQQFTMLPDVGQGLENRLFEAGKAATSLDEFLEFVKTKRYTMARIRRILLAFYIGSLSSDLMMPPAFGRILAFNDRGVEIIKASREKNKEKPNRLAIPFSSDIKELYTSPIPAAKRFIQLTTLSTDLYALASRNIRRSGGDFTAKIGKLTTVEISENTAPAAPSGIEVTQGGKAQENPTEE